MKEEDIVLCKVKKVENTVVFVTLPNGKEGTIISSEIAPGRIKHMRHYVVPNKQIVCKILEISGNNIHLSLRRVASKERKEVMQNYKQDQSIKAALKQILQDNLEETIERILKDFESLTDFAKKAREDKNILNKYIQKTKQKAVEKIINKKRKSQQLKQNICIKCLERDGVKRLKKIFSIKNKNAVVSYVSAGNFQIKLIVEDFKTGKKEMEDIIEEIEKKSKENSCEFNIIGEK